MELGLYKVSLDDAMKSIELNKNNKNVINDLNIKISFISHLQRISNNFMYFKNSSKLKRGAIFVC